MDAAERWNARYADASLVPFPDAPPPWLVAHRDLLEGGGRALDVACGDGRAAAYLASLGYEVVAIDVADVAIDALRAAARERALPIDARVVDLERDPLPPGPFDVVVVLNYLQRDLHGALHEALAPGGLLLVETFGAAHLDELRRSFNPDYVVARGELREAFASLQVVDHHEGVVERGGGPRGVAAIVARRPHDPPGH